MDSTTYMKHVRWRNKLTHIKTYHASNALLYSMYAVCTQYAYRSDGKMGKEKPKKKRRREGTEKNDNAAKI